MKITYKGFITCKSAEQYIDCADNYAINKNSHRFSVSDGVSKSFFPKVWSEILVAKFIERTDLNENELIKFCQEEWQKRIDEKVSLPDTKWFTKSQYNRKDPALATFVGLQFFEKEKKWSAWAIGDSFLFFVPDGFKDYQKELIKLSSKPEPVEFDNFPDYLSSIGNNHKGLPGKNISHNMVNGTFYLMTDALAEWFIMQKENAVNKIKAWRNRQDFEVFLAEARESKIISDDDSAILCIELSEVEKNGLEYNKKSKLTYLNDLIIDQEKEKEKIKQKKIEEEKKREKETQIKKSTEQETAQNESQNPESPTKETNEVPACEGFISKSINAVKSFFISSEEFENQEVESLKENANIEIVSIEKPTLKQQEPTTEELSDSESKVAVNQNFQNEEIDEEKIEVEAKSEKIEDEKLDPKEQSKVDSRAKKIFDKF